MKLFSKLICCAFIAAPQIFAAAAVSVDFDNQVKAPAITTSNLYGEVEGRLVAEKSPYVVEGVITVGDGKTLVVEAGVTVLFEAGTGLEIHGGTLKIAGEFNKPVFFSSREEGALWNGVTIVGPNRANIRSLRVIDAELGIAVEHSSAELVDVRVEKSTIAGLFARNSYVKVARSNFSQNPGIGLWAGTDAMVEISASKLEENHTALMAGQSSKLSFNGTKIRKNQYGLVDMGETELHQRGSQLTLNDVGFVGKEVATSELKVGISKNMNDYSSDLKPVAMNASDEPRSGFADRYMNIAPERVQDKDARWSLSGNVAATVGYHMVFMHKNHTGEDYDDGKRIIAPGKEYRNYFQIPGLFGNVSAYMEMKSSKGDVLEFSADLSSDKWNYFDIPNFQVSYANPYVKLMAGDLFISAGDSYLAGINILGASVLGNIATNAVGAPLFELYGFVGESNKPKIVGERNPDIYSDIIDDGEAEAQEMVVGSTIRWNMHRRFNGKLGFIGSKDYLEDPYLRDGLPAMTNTVDPQVSSRTFIAEGNWLFFPGDIELNGQVAVGGADTANVLGQRAINKVFSNAGLNISNGALLRSLMKGRVRPQDLSDAQLEDLFGDNTGMIKSEMVQKLNELIEDAKTAQAEYKDQDEGSMSSWGGENMAVAASLRWDLGKTLLNAHVRYVGYNYYSAGSPDQLQNYREYGASIDQKVLDYWNLGLLYDLDIENAGRGRKHNLFGFNEGSRLGLFSGEDHAWLDNHELDNVHPLYNHDVKFSNVFDITKDIKMSMVYNFNYRIRSTSLRLYGDFSPSSGVYNDPWFRTGSKDSIPVPQGEDTIYIDKDRFAQYYDLRSEDFLASQFEERIMKHSFAMNLQWKLPYNILRVGGQWIFRLDHSLFRNDTLLKGFNFENKTYGMLGYYFHGGDYFDQQYPISLTTEVGSLRNMLSVTPRFKFYNRYNMKEFEWNATENFSVALADGFLDLSMEAGFRHEILKRTENGNRLSETEIDVHGSASLRVHHTNSLYTDWTVGALCNHRPDSPADGYRDLYGILSLNYAF